MLNKDPKLRITIREMKKHPFFGSIDWAKLLSKEIKPPIILEMEDSDGMEQTEPDNEETLFLSSFDKLGSGEGERKKDIFKDKDYSKQNQTLNRVKQFTFIRDQRN